MTLDVKILGDAESARFMVVFLHGYGADGQDLLGLGQVMGDDLPDTIFAAPDAPHPCLINPLGRAWFAIPAFDGSEISFAESQMRVSIDALHNWLDKASRDFNIPAERIVLFGFSQGTMMALHIAPRRAEPVAGVVGFSGRLLFAEDLSAKTRARPPVFLAHGDKDEVVDYAEMALAKDALIGAGFSVQTHTSAGAGHSIAPESLALAIAFIRENLGLKDG